MAGHGVGDPCFTWLVNKENEWEEKMHGYFSFAFNDRTVLVCHSAHWGRDKTINALYLPLHPPLTECNGHNCIMESGNKIHHFSFVFFNEGDFCVEFKINLTFDICRGFGYFSFKYDHHWNANYLNSSDGKLCSTSFSFIWTIGVRFLSSFFFWQTETINENKLW